MKKIMLMALMSVMALGASAQMLTSRTYTKAKKPTMWYARVGASFNNVAGLGDAEYEEEGNEFSWGSKTGLAVDFGFQKPIGKSGLYWGMEFGLGTRGYSWTEKEEYRDGDYVESSENKASLLTWNLTYSPFTIGYKYSVTDKIKIDAHFGGFLSYDFAHGISAERDGKELEDIDWDNFKEESGYEDFDGGIQLGIGVWYDRFNLDVTWQRGFSALNEAEAIDESGYATDYVTGSASNLMLRLGISF